MNRCFYKGKSIVKSSKTWKIPATGSLFLLALCLLVTGCNTQHTITVEPIKIEPIYVHATIDVNVRVDKDLDKFFDFQAPASAPASQPAGGK